MTTLPIAPIVPCEKPGEVLLVPGNPPIMTYDFSDGFHGQAAMSEHSSIGVYLKAMTLEAQNALHGHRLEITRFPFRIGRESRGPNANWKRGPSEDRRNKGNQPSNDLYLWEQSTEKHISREHCEIQREGDCYFLFDRESALGTWVEGQLVGGGRRWGRTPLQNGDVIIVGPHTCGFIFKFALEPKTEVIASTSTVEPLSSQSP